jgi:hypothetical protein
MDSKAYTIEKISIKRKRYLNGEIKRMKNIEHLRMVKVHNT